MTFVNTKRKMRTDIELLSAQLKIHVRIYFNA